MEVGAVEISYSLKVTLNEPPKVVKPLESELTQNSTFKKTRNIYSVYV